MRHALIATLLVASTAIAALPGLTLRTEQGITLAAPADWKVLVTPAEHNAVMSRDAFTNLHLHWYPYKDGVSMDKVLDKLISVTNDSLPMGQVVEQSRTPVLNGRGKLAVGQYEKFGYALKMGFVVVIDQPGGDIKSGIFLTSPDAWSELQGEQMLVQVADSLQIP